MVEGDRVAARMGQELIEVVGGLWDWRAQHPQATLTEIEAAVDERFNTARAALLQELAQLSRAADVSGQPAAGRSRCPDCGSALQPLGKQARTVVTTGGKEIRLERDYARCPSCRRGLFPPR